MSKQTTLPSIIIERILHFFVSGTCDNTWKDNLPIAAINHEWREAAIPIVYKTGFIVEGDYGTTDFNCDNSQEYIETISGITNIDLIRTIGQTCHVRNYIISLDCNVGESNLVNYIDNLFDYENNDWSQIKSITFVSSKSYRDHDYTRHSTDNDKYNKAIMQAARNIIKAMPNVTKLVVAPEHKMSLDISLPQLLAEAYFSQLKFLEFDEFADLEIPLANMQHLSVQNHLNFSPITTECLANLQYLSLGSFSSFEWLGTISESSNLNIVFPQLTHLSLLFAELFNPLNFNNDSHSIDSEKNEKLVRVHFPALESLKLKLPSPDIIDDILFSGKYVWPNIKVLEIDGKIGYPRVSGTINSTDNTLFKDIASQIFLTMPHISKLKFTNDVNISNDPIVSSLVNKYSSQLDMLICNIPIETSNIVFGQNLGHLILDVKLGFSCIIIERCIQSLQILNLINVSHNFTWKNTSSNQDSVLRFSCLKTLLIKLRGYNGGIKDDYNSFVSNQSSNRCKLICPILTRVEIDNAIMSTLDNILHFDSNACPNVKTLSITFPKGNRLTVKTPSPQISTRTFYPFCHKIVQGMPNVTSLNILHSNINICTSVFANMLHRHYQEQLREFVCYSTLLASNVRYNNICKLHVKVGNQKNLESKPPQMNCSNLQDINILDNSAKFSWKWFADSNVGNIVKLDNVNDFVLHINPLSYEDMLCGPFRVYSDENYKSTKVSMPRLRNLDIKINGCCNDLTPTDLHFKNANVVSLSGHAHCLPIRSNMQSNVFQKLTMDISSAETKDKDYFYMLTNSWFGNYKFSGETSLKLQYLSFRLDISRIMWDNLEKLEMSPSISTSNMLLLLSKIHNLKYLSIKTLDADKTFADVDPENQKTYISSLPSLIDTLLIGHIDKSNVKKSLNIFHCLVLSLPSLKLVSDNIAGFNIDNFTDRFKGKYPHVATLDSRHFHYNLF